MIEVYITRRQDKTLTAAGDISILLAIERGEIGPETQVSCIRVVERIFCPHRDVDHRTAHIKRSQKRHGVGGLCRPWSSEKGTSTPHLQERCTAECCAVVDSEAECAA